MNTKICNKCGILKKSEEYYKHRGICINCQSLKDKEKYKSDLEFRNAAKLRAKIYRNNNKEFLNIKEDVICDFKISKFCKINYKIGLYKLKENKENNDGLYRCKYCAIESCHVGTYYKYQKDDTYFENINTEDKAYLLGVIAGDGHISKNNFEVVANSTDIETLLLFKYFISPDVNPKKDKSSNCYRIQICSRKMCNDLRAVLNLNTSKKSDKITLPNLPEDLLWHFIRGLMDTDGCISNPMAKTPSPKCFYSSTSNKILTEVQNLCNSYNIYSVIRGIKLEFNSGPNALKFLNKVYYNSTISLTRKRCYYKIWATWIPYDGTVIRPTKRFLRRLEREQNNA